MSFTLLALRGHVGKPTNEYHQLDIFALPVRLSTFLSL